MSSNTSAPTTTVTSPTLGKFQEINTVNTYGKMRFSNVHLFALIVSILADFDQLIGSNTPFATGVMSRLKAQHKFLISVFTVVDTVLHHKPQPSFATPYILTGKYDNGESEQPLLEDVRTVRKVKELMQRITFLVTRRMFLFVKDREITPKDINSVKFSAYKGDTPKTSLVLIDFATDMYNIWCKLDESFVESISKAFVEAKAELPPREREHTATNDDTHQKEKVRHNSQRSDTVHEQHKRYKPHGTNTNIVNRDIPAFSTFKPQQKQHEKEKPIIVAETDKPILKAFVSAPPPTVSKWTNPLSEVAVSIDKVKELTQAKKIEKNDKKDIYELYYTNAESNCNSPIVSEAKMKVKDGEGFTTVLRPRRPIKTKTKTHDQDASARN